MPESPEIDTDRLRETIDAEIEKEGGTLLRSVALTTALLAALAAVAALQAGGSANEALLLKTESTRLQAEASDQWAYYQAKGIKAAMVDSVAQFWTALDKPVPGDLAASRARYIEDQRKSKENAEALEQRRDRHSAEADHLMHRHEFYAGSVALLQVSIALGAVAALTRSRAVWIGSSALGLFGAAVLGYAFVS